MNYKDGYAINGMWFVAGMNPKGNIVMPSDDIEKLFNNIIDKLNKKYKESIIIPFQTGWLYSSFFDYGKTIPSYHFQCSFKDKESSTNASKDLLDKIDELVGNTASIVIVIANGDIKDTGDPHNADGMAYVRSGTFLESPEVWMHKFNKNNRIFLLEGDYLIKTITEIKRYKDI